ncbi:MAG: oligopeptide transporter, OPT family [Chitinivibrionales bacterium]|nr:oligopeptide transporter, OPT family [Chitinivibrionales bacterium]
MSNSKVANSTTFQPYIPAEKSMPELTILSIVLGSFLAILFGAANAYLGLRAGLTVAASIPASVMSMAIIRGVLRRKSILENNIVQTIGSAGEAVAAGIIFTIPAFFFWNAPPTMFKIFLIALLGGFLGVLLMIPLRAYLIVQEHGKLAFPEGTACADVLIAGEEGGLKAAAVFWGVGAGLVYSFFSDVMALFSSSVSWPVPRYKGAVIGGEITPMLLGVGYIIGIRASALIFSGAMLGWFVIIPLITFFGGYITTVIPPSTDPINQMGPFQIWSKYLRYIGAGAVVCGGMLGLIRAIPTIINAFSQSMKGFSAAAQQEKRTDKNIPMNIILISAAVLIVIMALLPQFKIGFVGAILVAVFGFFFVTVSSRIVGVIGNSSNPVSGMTIATLLFVTFIMKMLGFSGQEGMFAVLCVGGIVCVGICLAGDNSQDLKTGFLVGATPWKQQIGLLVGVVVAAIVIGYILVILNKAYGLGSEKLPAPQANLMKVVIEGIMGGQMPWILVFIGIFIALFVEVLGIASLPFAIGLYLPITLSTPIIIGALTRVGLEKMEKDAKLKDAKVEKGVLYASGLIAGGGLMGVINAIFITANLKLAVAKPILGQFGSLIVFLILTVTLYYISNTAKKDNA